VARKQAKKIRQGWRPGEKKEARTMPRIKAAVMKRKGKDMVILIRPMA
jgi:hypothetical protein